MNMKYLYILGGTILTLSLAPNLYASGDYDSQDTEVIQEEAPTPNMDESSDAGSVGQDQESTDVEDGE